MHAKGELIDAVAYRHTDTNDGGKNRRCIDHATNAPSRLGTEHCRKGRSNRQWHIAPISKVRQRHPDNGITAPGCQAIVQECPFIGRRQIIALKRSRGTEDDIGVVGKMRQRFSG